MDYNLKPLKGRYLITGASGLMGTTSLLRLKNIPGIKVRAIYHKQKPIVEGDNIEYICGDLRNKEFCLEISKDIDYLFMFAAVLATASNNARNPISPINDTLIMNVHMLEAAFLAKIKKYVWLSSSTGYPDKTDLLSENDMFIGEPPKVYYGVGWMTRYLETLCRFYSLELAGGFQTVLIRPTTIYGEYETFDLNKCHMLPALVRKVVDKHVPLEIWGDGNDERDLIYSDDVFDACLLAMKRHEPFNVFNVGHGKLYSVKNLLNIIIHYEKYPLDNIRYDLSKPRAIRKRNIDLSKSIDVLEFIPKTSIKEGIKKLIYFYKKNSKLL
jgi:GDP-L-fucose synthase